jgi:hypothetical protein
METSGSDESNSGHERCDSCDACLSICLSCGMPMTSPDSFGGGLPGNQYCVHCCHPDGSLKSYDEVFAGMTNFMMNSQHIDKASAESAVRDYLARMPAWSHN